MFDSLSGAILLCLLIGFICFRLSGNLKLSIILGVTVFVGFFGIVHFTSSDFLSSLRMN